MVKFLIMQTVAACLQQPVTKNTLDDGWGTTFPNWFILALPKFFMQFLAIDFVIAVNCFNLYKYATFTN